MSSVLLTNPVHDHNTVVMALMSAEPLLPEAKRITIKSCTRDGDAFDQFVLVSEVRTVTRFSGKFKKLPPIDDTTLSRAANDLDFAWSLEQDGLFEAFKKAIAVAPRSSQGVRQVFITYVGLVALGYGLTPDLSRIPQPFIRYEDAGPLPEVVA